MDNYEFNKETKNPIRNSAHSKIGVFSEFHSSEIRISAHFQFGFPLTEKVAQTLFYKSIQCFIKSIIKVIKKSFLLKRKMWIKNLL